ncbi:MAG: type IV pilin [Candidatus Thermoplasmatota archaeon]|nr:type IV pilin [Candidatus Thermoplasmatota archaeon]
MSAEERNMLNKGRNAVSPVIAIILMVSITVVLAAVLMVVVQDVAEESYDGFTLMATNVQNNPDGWLVSIIKGSVLNNAELDWYIRGPTGDRIGNKTNDTRANPPGTLFTFNDNNNNSYLDGGDTIFIQDPAQSFRNQKFIISTGTNFIEVVLK